MAKYKNKVLDEAFNQVIATLPTYFRTCYQMFVGLQKAFQDEGKTGSDKDDPFVREYNWCYGFGDFGEAVMSNLPDRLKISTYNGITKAPRFAVFRDFLWEMATIFNTGGMGYNGSPLPRLKTEGADSPLKILRYDNSEITNTKLKNALRSYNGIADAIWRCGMLASFNTIIFMNFPIDYGGKTSKEVQQMSFQQAMAHTKKCALNDFSPIKVRQVVSYAQYELEPILEAKEREINDHFSTCAECEEEGECDIVFGLYDEEGEIQDNIIAYIENKLGGLGNTNFNDSFKYMRDPLDYKLSYGSVQSMSNPMRFIGVDTADVPTKNYTGSMADHSLTATWSDLISGNGYKSAVYNVVFERTLALPYLTFDEAETTYTNGNPHYIKSNLWSWLNSRKDGSENNDRLWRERQHNADACNAIMPYRGYLSCVYNDLLQHTTAFVEREQYKNVNGGYTSTHFAQISYITIAGSTLHNQSIYSDEKIGTTSISRVGQPMFGGYYQQVYRTGGTSALKEARKMVIAPSISTSSQKAIGVATRAITGGKQIVALNDAGTYISAYPKDTGYFAARPLHRLFPFYMTNKYGVPRQYTKGVTLESVDS